MDTFTVTPGRGGNLRPRRQRRDEVRPRLFTLISDPVRSFVRCHANSPKISASRGDHDFGIYVSSRIVYHPRASARFTLAESREGR